MNRALKEHVQIFIVALVVFLGAIALEAGQSVAVFRGTYDYEVGSGDGPSQYEDHYDFEAQISGCTWTIIYTNRAFYTNPEVLNFAAKASCDGTNIYLVQFQSDEGNKAAWKEKYDTVKGELPTALGEIIVGVVPPPTKWTLQSLWTAFASGCVLKEQSGTVKLPNVVDPVVFYDTNFFSDYSWSTNADRESDRQLILTTSGSHFGLDRETGKLRWFAYPSPYDHGFTNAIGLWHQTTNIDGTLFPLDFEFRSFAPLALVRGAKPSLQQIYVYRCAVKDVDFLPGDAVPVLPPEGHVLVFDRRFQSLGFAKISYVITNGLWASLDSPALSNRIKYGTKSTLYEEALIGHGLVAPHKAPRKYVIWILFALPTLFVLGKFASEKLKTTKGKK